MNDGPLDETVCDFLLRLAEDSARGDVLPLGEYLKRFPGHDDLVARRWLEHGSADGGLASDDDVSNTPDQRVHDAASPRVSGASRYEVGHELGRGGMAAVFSAHDRELDRELAMKVLTRPGSVSAHRFQREARLTAKLCHPGVVPIHDLGFADDGRPFFTMQRVDGRTLREVIDRHHGADREWPMSRVIDVVLRVCETMAFAHTRGVVHRDLKPSNVMVGGFGEVYVMDWGVARELGSGAAERDDEPEDRDTAAPVTLDGDVLGTPSYMAPEQALGQVDQVGPALDVYSAGAMLYHALSGHMPYATTGESTSSRVILERVRRHQPARLTVSAHAPPELIAIQEKAMARDPARRYADMGDMAADLRAFLELRVVGAYAGSPMRRLTKWVRRHRGLAAGLGLTAATALTAAVVYAGQRAERTRVASLLAAPITPGAIAKTFRALWPIDSDGLDVLRDLDAQAHALLSRRDELAAERERVRSQARPLDPTAPAERAAAVAVAASIRSRQQLVAEFERMLAAVDAGEEQLPPRYDRAFYEGQITHHREEIERLRTAPPSRQTWRFEDPLEDVLFAALTRFDHDVASLADEPRHPGLAKILGRSIELVEAADHRRPPNLDEAWMNTCGEIADTARSPAYQGLRVPPRPGLVPLGRDPDTGLQEFAHLLSGEIPRRDAHGRLLLAEDSAMVLVLLPAGELMRGAQSKSTEIPRYDPLEAKDEMPYAPIRMRPFYLGKHEVTQAQWARLTTANPSCFGPVTGAAFSVTEMHPVECVSFDDASPVLASVGLTFPSEAQWEYAVRAGTDTPWFTGTDRDSIDGYANIADRRAVEAKVCHRGRASWWPELDDGFAVHAPVDALRPNPFGLYGMLGNVAEWCGDQGPVDLDRCQEDLRDQSRLGTPSGSRPVRGGSFATSYHETRSAARRHAGPSRRDMDLGLRVAMRALD